MYRLFALFLLTSLLAGCGGGGSSTSTGGSGNPPPTGGGTGGGTTPGNASVVTVSAGSSVSGVDIRVPGAASNPAPNAQNLGVAELTGSGSAFNTGDTILRGTTKRVILFGTALTGSMTVAISGPSDISITDIRSITANDGTPGISFTATVSGSATLGGRTVSLTSSSGDVTTFTGGLEVVAP